MSAKIGKFYFKKIMQICFRISITASLLLGIYFGAPFGFSGLIATVLLSFVCVFVSCLITLTVAMFAPSKIREMYKGIPWAIMIGYTTSYIAIGIVPALYSKLIIHSTNTNYYEGVKLGIIYSLVLLPLSAPIAYLSLKSLAQTTTEPPE